MIVEVQNCCIGLLVWFGFVVDLLVQCFGYVLNQGGFDIDFFLWEVDEFEQCGIGLVVDFQWIEGMQEIFELFFFCICFVKEVGQVG